MAAAHLRRALGAEWMRMDLACFQGLGPADREVLDRMMARGVNSPATSSCGRLFDAAAAILGFRGAMTYSAQAPMELEARAARAARARAYPKGEVRNQEGTWVLDPAPLVRALAGDAAAGADPAECSLGFHRSLAALFAEGAARAAADVGTEAVFLSGGCFQNALFLDAVCRELEARGLRPFAHRRLPPGDGCIAFGQAAWVLARDG